MEAMAAQNGVPLPQLLCEVGWREPMAFKTTTDRKAVQWLLRSH